MLDVKTDEPQEERKGKKEKDKNTKLVYSDNDISPEEKMAQLPRYAFAPGGKEDSVVEDATTAAVTESSTWRGRIIPPTLDCCSWGSNQQFHAVMPHYEFWRLKVDGSLEKGQLSHALCGKLL